MSAPGKFRRGRPPLNLQELWPYLKLVEDHCQQGKKQNKAANLVADRYYRHLPGKGNKDSAIRLLKKYHTEYQEKLSFEVGRNPEHIAAISNSLDAAFRKHVGDLNRAIAAHRDEIAELPAALNRTATAFGDAVQQLRISFSGMLASIHRAVDTKKRRD